ncbi:hypothetical protein VTN02DRAFT_986 [Thermoascus thermophilus]
MATTESQPSSSSSSVYATNHTPAVLRTHQWRTATNSAPHLLPHLRPDMTILDVGCGPGTITVDLARHHVPRGRVTGIECVPAPLAAAREHAAALGVRNVDFRLGDALDLRGFPDGSVDVVHAHQVLQHVARPVDALRAMRRVARCLVSLRETARMDWFPRLPGLDRWYRIYRRVAEFRGGHPDPGADLLPIWLREAGFDVDDPARVRRSTGSWCFRSAEDRAWWSGVWMERVVSEAFVTGAVEAGVVEGKGELEEIRDAWREWGMCEGAWFVVEHGEVVCWV